MRIKRIEIKDWKDAESEVMAVSQVGCNDWTLYVDENQAFFDMEAGYTLCSLFNYYFIKIKGGHKLFE